MIRKFSDIALIWKVYAPSIPLRLFVSIRYLVVPWRRILGALPSFHALLDFGCGHGLFLNLVAAERTDALLRGVEHDEQKLEQVKRCSIPTNIRITSVEDLAGDPQARFDCATIMDVLYCVPRERWVDVFAMIRARLNPGGVLIVKDTIDAPKWKVWITSLQELVALRLLKYTKGEPAHLDSVQDFISEIEKAGFKVTEHYAIDRFYVWPHYIFIAVNSRE